MIPFSVLDLAPVPDGASESAALANTLDLARHAEALGYHRYWLAEHHGMPGIASAATSVVIAAVGAVTKRMRIGSGGIMLPNHAPMIIAEQFGTLAALYGDRVDLGLGRAPGTDGATLRALRRNYNDAERFPDDVAELMMWFKPPRERQIVRAVPGAGAKVDVWILGSSLFGAELAAQRGLPYAFASHFAPAQMMEAARVYRAHFQPSEFLAKPYLMLGVNVVAADTDEEARYLQSSIQQAFVNLRKGQPGLFPRPVRDYEATLGFEERALLDHALRCSVVGSPARVREGLKAFIAQTGADELMLTAQIHDHEARKKSFQLAFEARD